MYLQRFDSIIRNITKIYKATDSYTTLLQPIRAYNHNINMTSKHPERANVNQGRPEKFRSTLYTKKV